MCPAGTCCSTAKLAVTPRRATAPQEQFEDELFDRLYSGDADLLPEKKRNPTLREWAEKVHAACEQLPAFGRLVQECKGRPAAAATAVEALMGELGSLTESPTTPAQQQRARRRIAAGCEKASAAVDELMDTMEALGQVFFANLPGSGTGVGADLPVSSIRGLAQRLRDDARLRRIALLAGRFKRIAASKRRQKVKHGADEISDITQGADIARLLPSELSKLGTRTLRLLFMRDLLERQCLQYQLTGAPRPSARDRLSSRSTRAAPWRARATSGPRRSHSRSSSKPSARIACLLFSSSMPA